MDRSNDSHAQETIVWVVYEILRVQNRHSNVHNSHGNQFAIYSVVEMEWALAWIHRFLFVLSERINKFVVVRSRSFEHRSIFRVLGIDDRAAAHESFQLFSVSLLLVHRQLVPVVNIIQLFGEDRAMQLNRVPVLRLCHGNVLDVRQKILLKLCKFRVALFLLTLLFLYRFLLNLLAKYGLPFFSEV